MGAAAVPLIMTAVAAGAQAYNTRQTEKRQDNQLASQLRAQAQKQREADAKTAHLVQQEAGSTDKDEKAGLMAGFNQQMLAKAANAQRPLQTQGAVSEAYQKAGSDAALGITNFGNQFAGNVAAIDAPALQRQNDELQRGRYQTELGLIKRNSSGDDYLAEMKLRGIKRNPWIDAGSQVLGGMAGAYGGGGYGAMGGATESLVQNSPALTNGAGWWNAYGTSNGTKPSWSY